jgi:hypothetical protein
MLSALWARDGMGTEKSVERWRTALMDLTVQPPSQEKEGRMEHLQRTSVSQSMAWGGEAQVVECLLCKLSSNSSSTKKKKKITFTVWPERQNILMDNRQTLHDSRTLNYLRSPESPTTTSAASGPEQSGGGQLLPASVLYQPEKVKYVLHAIT